MIKPKADSTLIIESEPLQRVSYEDSLSIRWGVNLSEDAKSQKGGSGYPMTEGKSHIPHQNERRKLGIL